MKWYNHKTYHTHYANLRLHRDRQIDDISVYYSWVIDIVNGFNTEYAATGILTRMDLIQAGNEGLVRAWANLDWNAIQELPEAEQQPYIWSYLKKGIKLYVREEIDKYGAFIRIPIRTIKKQRADKSKTIRVFADLFPRFFDTDFPELVEEIEPWDNIRLYEFLIDLLEKHIPNSGHRTILTLSYGIDTQDDKPMPIKEIAKLMSISEIGVKKAKSRTLQLLRENEDVQEKIKNYLEN